MQWHGIVLSMLTLGPEDSGSNPPYCEGQSVMMQFFFLDVYISFYFRTSNGMHGKDTWKHGYTTGG